MGKMTFVVDFPDGQEPAVSAGTDILGGKVEMVAWRDISEDNAWQRVEKCQPGPGVMVLLSDGVKRWHGLYRPARRLAMDAGR
ncbi:Uncharacterised protein [Cedecea neteri]|uniref:Uncharacterized protein n=1 Tax=Cedecea neteri TaxID=158822 RepID=A0A2X3L1B9_9ENTR|nr:Uncharacterised protein [Cedecea neteri]